MKLLHASIYLLVTLGSAAVAGLQPAEPEALEAGTMVAVTHEVLSSLAMEDASAPPSRAE